MSNLCCSFQCPSAKKKNKKKDREIITVIQSDIGVICDAGKIDDQGCCSSPDLIIEILSPGNPKKEVTLKFEVYEQAGANEYWIIYPSEESIAVFVLNEAGKYNGANLYTTRTISKVPQFPSYTLTLQTFLPNSGYVQFKL